MCDCISISGSKTPENLETGVIWTQKSYDNDIEERDIAYIIYRL